jgi:hypothetical protein
MITIWPFSGPKETISKPYTTFCELRLNIILVLLLVHQIDDIRISK